MSMINNIDPKFAFAYECGKNFFYSGLTEEYYKVEDHNNRDEELKAFRAGYLSAEKEYHKGSNNEDNAKVK